MKAGGKRFRRRSRGASLLEALEAHLQTKDDAAWYAERLERLGVVMFGELWETDKPKFTAQNQKRSGLEPATGTARCTGPCGRPPGTPHRDVPTTELRLIVQTQLRSFTSSASPRLLGEKVFL